MHYSRIESGYWFVGYPVSFLERKNMITIFIKNICLSILFYVGTITIKQME